MNEHAPVPVVDVHGLSKAFGRFRALDGLDLVVAVGEVHGFLGPNGAGKSTTIRVLLGMYRRTGGEVRVLGLDPGREPAAVTRRTAYVPGDVALWPALTGQEVLDALGGLRGRRDRTRERELVEAFSLDPSRPVHTYSKGNRQKVALVAALASRCELLVLDEPTSGLDPLQEEVFQDCARRIAGEGRTILLSSHVLAEVEHLCQRVTIVKDGRTVETGSLARLRHLASSRVTCRLPGGVWPRVLAGLPPAVEADARPRPAPEATGRVDLAVGPDDVPAVLRVLLDAGAHELTCTPATLEDLFLRHYQAAAR